LFYLRPSVSIGGHNFAIPAQSAASHFQGPSMRATLSQKLHALAIGVLLITTPMGGYQTGESESTPGGAADTATMSADQLRALTAPIALYPDPLVAQILAASTFPDQVAVANYWLREHRGLAARALAEQAGQQYWDPSVKALTQFPPVLNNMAKNLAWASLLGEAYHQQPSEVMAAIQALRAQALARGTLMSGAQIRVTQPTPDVIRIEPANPLVVCVPEYDPAAIFGVPYAIPDYTPAAIAANLPLAFGPAIAVGAFGGWSWDGWGMDWHGGAVAYNRNRYFGNPAWHGGFYNGGYRAGYGYQNPYDHTAASNNRGYAARAAETRDQASALDRGEAFPHSWAHADEVERSNAFGGLADGWQSRAESFRGWGSMRMSGFSGGRFGGERFGGGHFFRR
jgi:Protein of unknown function (DUF3300)